MQYQLKDKTMLITGANSGIGFATTLGLAKLGARVVMLCRNEDKGLTSQKRIISESGNPCVELIICDFSSLTSIRKAAIEFNRRCEKLDVLVNNAGGAFGKRLQTADGYEWNFGVNHLAPFLLTNLLLPSLLKSELGRVVTVASAAHKMGHINFDDLMTEKSYSLTRVYAQSKLANVLFAFELSRRLEGKTVTSNCLHPGVVASNFAGKDSGMWTFFFKHFGFLLASPEKGAETSVFLASSPEVKAVSGKYFVNCKPAASSKESQNEEVARRLWEVSEKLVSLK